MGTTTDDMPPAPPQAAVCRDRPVHCVWSCHPLREEPILKSLSLSAAIVGTALVTTVSFGSPTYGVIAVVVLLLATAGYLLPTRYVVDADGVASQLLVWRRRPWTTFRRAVRHPDGIFLSPFRQPHRLDAYRGVFLRFGAETCVDDIDSLVKAHVSD